MDKPSVFRDLHEYGRADLARRYPSTAGSQPPADPAALERALSDVARDGFAVLEGVLSPGEVEELRTDLLPLLPALTGRNNFEGFATRRLYAVMEKTLSCNPLVEHPLVLGLLDRILEPNYLLSQLQVIELLPGEAAQPLHHDDAFYPWPRPRPPLGVATIWPLDPFTEENGATVVLPGSHRRGAAPPDEKARATAKSVVMPAGSLLVFVGTLWHHAGANRTAAPRACVTAQYCAPWCRQQENFSLSVSRERARQASPHIQRLLGYSIHPPFMGFVDGMHPRRLLD